jgi:copper chaperone
MLKSLAKQVNNYLTQRQRKIRNIPSIPLLGKNREDIMATVKIKGMRCGHCVASVTRALSDIDGVKNVQVNLERGEATFDEAKPVDAAVIKKVISGIGFEVE